MAKISRKAEKATGQRFCSFCKMTKPLSEYLHFSAGGTRASWCNACAQSNMVRYWSNRTTAENMKKAAMDAKE